MQSKNKPEPSEKTMKEQINKFCEKYNLGSPSEEPVMVTGGLMHKMYRVVTEKGRYAIKVLNPDIMQRPDALQNMIQSEIISHRLRDIVSLVAAKSFGGEHVVRFEGHYYLVFDWLEGSSVFAPEITVEHCRQIGNALGKIHAADITVPGIKKEQGGREVYAWNMFLEEAEKQKEECYRILKDNLSNIIQWDKEVTESQTELLRNQVISHRDLDPKNVMWKSGRAYIIDWEAAGYVNPYQELVEVLNYWISDGEGRYDRQKFVALMQAYAENMNIGSVNWEEVLKCSFDGMLGWLEYNMKRTLGLEGSSNLDKQEGRKQVIGTINELKRYQEQTDILRCWIEEFAKGVLYDL
jgi:Ser/Thr protein kinase RdoA (MazF antagonist)